MRRRLPGLTVTAYVLLGAGTYVYSLATNADAWNLVWACFAFVWVACACGLVLRKLWALFVLWLFEVSALFGWVFEPGDWGSFVLQVILVLLLIAPPMDDYVRRPTPAHAGYPEKTRIPFALLAATFSVWGVVAAIRGDPSAIPIFTFLAILVLMQIQTETQDTKVS